MATETIAMEQVPLKSDTDKPAETETATTEITNSETGAAENPTAEQTAEPEQDAGDTDEKTKLVENEQKPADEQPIVAIEVPAAAAAAPATHTETTTTEKIEQKSRTGFGRFFHRGEKKVKEVTDELKEGDETKEGGETKAENDVAPKEPKPKFWAGWFEKKPKEPKEETDQPEKKDECMFGLNMLDRDEHNVNEHIKLNFEDILAEPDTNHSWDCSWRLTYRLFSWTRCFIYKLLALFLAIPCAIIWGFVFALLAVLNIWACVPFGRALTVPAIWLAKAWNFLIRSLFDPIFRSCGLCLGSINMRRYGINTDHTAEMVA